MPLFLGHTTAAHLLDALHVERMPHAIDSTLAHCLASKAELGHVDLSLLEDIPQPFDVLVSSAEERRSWEGVRCHVCPKELPANSFIELTHDLLVASPELLFVLQAQQLSLARTIRLESWLCGTYLRDKDGKLSTRPALTTPRRLATFIESCPQMKGVSRARRAVPWVIAQSASPMEAPCAIPFYLPRRLGGFGFPRPYLNYRVTLGQAAHRMVNKQWIVIDIYWPDALWGLEYQGQEYHGSELCIAQDIARQLAAERSGITLQMLTIEQLRDPDQRLYIAQKTARHLGVACDVDNAFMRANQRLVDDVLSDLSEPG